MALDNPAFKRNSAFSSQGAVAAAQDVSAQQLQEMYNQPATLPDREVMTIETTVQKAAVSFGLLVVGAALGWLTTESLPFLWIGAGIAGFVLALVNIFKKEPSPGLILAYAGVQGVFVGGISAWYELAFGGGIVAQAVIATLVVVGVTLALFASGKIRASKRATKIFLVAMVGYLVFSLVNLGLQMFNVVESPWGVRGFEIMGIPLGVILGVLVVIMAAYSLVLDFDFIQQGVRNRAPKKYEWTGVFGIMVTVIWLYLEILRMLAIIQSSD
ncbi:Bax inhibitor-1/YccA family protein [Agromyces sp. ISL-38]|uniref:Bax inhibitor-1/YccA family protein n=1 Tax=Agromyces sp. ISL-38 TaxID=2819107 RepID=UPI001BEAD1C5|nr:Bax inhibitor-1/YccA family protein [Agromyces sp. ISL-38]MBT2498726.1 Bax inhibitor-1/YccA family protein [Agromyces sp. ISL-38]MBT2518593.1 Bax inhibitor-1/YccA family protein [Streptomyces sp. ISL-90]